MLLHLMSLPLNLLLINILALILLAALRHFPAFWTNIHLGYFLKFGCITAKRP